MGASSLSGQVAIRGPGRQKRLCLHSQCVPVEKYCRGLNNYQHIPNAAVVSSTSNRPQDDISNLLQAFSRLNLLSAGLSGVRFR